MMAPHNTTKIVDLTEDSSDDDIIIDISEDTEQIVDLTEDGDDDVTVGLSEDTEQDDDLNDFTNSAPDLSDIIDDDTLEKVHRSVNKALGAKAKRDYLKVDTKNDIRVKKNSDAKLKYHTMNKQARSNLNTRKCIKQREVRADIDNDPSTKREILDRRNEKRAKAKACKNFAVKHNLMYPSKADRLKESQREKSG